MYRHGHKRNASNNLYTVQVCGMAERAVDLSEFDEFDKICLVELEDIDKLERKKDKKERKKSEHKQDWLPKPLLLSKRKSRKLRDAYYS